MTIKSELEECIEHFMVQRDMCDNPKACFYCKHDITALAALRVMKLIEEKRGKRQDFVAGVLDYFLDKFSEYREEVK